MTDNIKYGGPAFPSQKSETQDGRWNQTYEPGMTLRDWFAGMALQGLLAGTIRPKRKHQQKMVRRYGGEFLEDVPIETEAQTFACFSYDLAAAMLSRRSPDHD